MKYEQKEGWIALFQNRSKREEKHPDLRGEGLFKGQWIKIAGWEKRDRQGNLFVSIHIEPKPEGPYKPTEDKSSSFNKTTEKKVDKIDPNSPIDDTDIPW